MRKRYCVECGGEIMITRRVPERSWTIGEENFDRADNNITDDPDIIFHCENDLEHDIGIDSPSFDRWQDEILDEYHRKIVPFL